MTTVPLVGHGAPAANAHRATPAEVLDFGRYLDAEGSPPALDGLPADSAPVVSWRSSGDGGSDAPPPGDADSRIERPIGRVPGGTAPGETAPRALPIGDGTITTPIGIVEGGEGSGANSGGARIRGTAPEPTETGLPARSAAADEFLAAIGTPRFSTAALLALQTALKEI